MQKQTKQKTKQLRLILGGGVLLAVGLFLFVLSKRPSFDQIMSSDAVPERVPIEKELKTSSKQEILMGHDTHELSDADQGRLMVLEHILSTRNDNDPRLDSEFQNISEPLKEAMKEKFTQTPREQLNQKGLLVLLVGQNTRSLKDIEWLQAVLDEKPCLSLSDCQTPPSVNTAEEAHSGEIGLEVTLNYPQLVAIETFNSTYDKVPALRTAILEALEKASKNGTTPAIRGKAMQTLNNLKEKKSP